MTDFVSNLTITMAVAFVALVGALFLFLVVVYIRDRTQKEDAIIRNFPVLGHFRDFFTYLGTFFRQYFFALDREEQPFNRAQRNWVDRASEGKNLTVPFGSTQNLRTPGTIFFVNSVFPAPDEPNEEPEPITFGADGPNPFTTQSFFNVSAMSYGSISKPAVQALSHGARRAGIWLNTGEGGISPYHLEGGADLIFQIGTANYGVRRSDGTLDTERLAVLSKQPEVKMIELKLSQGAKPGKGGILPAEKVTEEIAEIRTIPPHQASISPNAHPGVDSLETLIDHVTLIRQTAQLPIGIKLVMGETNWLDAFCKLIQERGLSQAPDFITLDSADGGTGAAPQSTMDHVGLPIFESLPLLVDTLNRHQLRERIKVIASGKLMTPSAIAWALAMGADCVNNARGFMFALGCIQSLQCNKNTCPTGVATHDEDLQKGLDPADKAQRVAQYAKNVRSEVAMIARACGVKDPRHLKRHHARMIIDDTRSASLADLFPDVTAE